MISNFSNTFVTFRVPKSINNSKIIEFQIFSRKYESETSTNTFISISYVRV